MKRITICAMFIALSSFIFAQTYMSVWKNGVKMDIQISAIDSITFGDTETSNGIGIFSVSPNDKVTFSKGNLQYARFTNTWSFAENQWDVIGTDNLTGGSVSSDEDGYEKIGDDLADKIDLFGWSGSDGEKFGVSTSINEDDYSGSFVDWGTNEIGNDPRNTWRTLTRDEWNYVMFNRPNASSLNGIAQVNGVNGLILLPDNWICPKDVRFKSGFHIYEEIEYYAANQTFTADQWSLLEAAGAIFLPASGGGEGKYVGEVQGHGYYWSATEYDSRKVVSLEFKSDGLSILKMGRQCANSVRLVKDL